MLLFLVVVEFGNGFDFVVILIYEAFTHTWTPNATLSNMSKWNN